MCFLEPWPSETPRGIRVFWQPRPGARRGIRVFFLCFFYVFVMYWGPGQAQPNPGGQPAGQLPGSCRAAAGQLPGKITRGNVLSWQPWPLAIRGLNRRTSLTDAKRNEYVHAILISLIGLRKYMKKSCFLLCFAFGAFLISFMFFLYILTFLWMCSPFNAFPITTPGRQET